MDTQLDEILTILQEECAEVIQRASKLRRFGRFNSDTYGNTNIFLLQQELGDVMAMIDLLHAYDYVDLNHIRQIKHNKFEKLKKWSNIDIDYNKLKDL